MKDKEFIKEFVSVTESRYLKKGEHVIHIGETLKDVYFLERGISRGYILDINGKEITDCFSFECGSPAMPFGEMKLGEPATMAIEMLEDGKFFCLPIPTVIELLKKYSEAMKLYNILLLKALNEHWNLKRMLNQYTAIQRYQWFLEEYPGLIDRINNKYIASFLGMTPVTLSRLRRTLKEDGEKK